MLLKLYMFIYLLKHWFFFTEDGISYYLYLERGLFLLFIKPPFNSIIFYNLTLEVYLKANMVIFLFKWFILFIEAIHISSHHLNSVSKENIDTFVLKPVLFLNHPPWTLQLDGQQQLGIFLYLISEIDSFYWRKGNHIFSHHGNSWLLKEID